ncbi:protein-tyrosine sulfotransferase 1-like [Carassius carassius]|uniref:protein-tyrosine sulfotransferase 1-like n=1 Tax=Carassius carassius TaxID=217509 RepID=UPI002868BC7D|nr:protein-tyrosine sulfotransferase 1-like [Carassius carassius]
MRKKTCNVLLVCGVISSITVFYLGLSPIECPTAHSRSGQHGWAVNLQTGQNLSNLLQLPEEYNEETPLIFIGGVPRSGTTLMRAMLDAHPLVRCGEETRVIPRLLAMQASWSHSAHERVRLDEAGVTQEVLDSAVRAFLLEIIVGHGEPAPRLCNKDPFALKSLNYLSKLFPKAKFILMLRDGRATVHSMISRKVTITGFDLKSYRDCLVKWNRAVEVMYDQCLAAADGNCLPVHYEQLVLHPERVMHKLLQFLDLPWDTAVLHHEQFIGKAGGVSLSKVELSTDQVIKPVNTEALSKWVGKIPADVVNDMASLAPMLSRLGYDPLANPPNYNKPDLLFLKNTKIARAILN